MPDSNYSVAGLHLPERKTLTSRHQTVSFLINDIILIISGIVLIWGLSRFPFAENPFFGFLAFHPLIAALFILAGSTLFFSAKLTDRKKTTLWGKLIPIVCAQAVSLVGTISIFQDIGIPPMVGFSFFLLGQALFFPHIQFSHRFHATQLMVSLIINFNAVVLLGDAYQLLSPFVSAGTNYIPLNISLLFIFFSIGILMRWSNRGFLGSFTAQSASSTFALRSLNINLVIMPLIGFFALALMRNGMYVDNIYKVVALTVMLIMAATAILAWFNIKLLYKFELEHFVMKEALRVHNIDLKLEHDDQKAKIEELKKTEETYREKINYQDSFKDIAERLG